MAYVHGKLWLYLNDYKHITPLTEKLREYEIKVTDTFKICAMLAAEYDANKYTDAAGLEKMLLNIQIDGKKAINKIDLVQKITYPEKMKEPENLKVTGLNGENLNPKE